jgi:nitrile hydratase beta subunit
LHDRHGARETARMNGVHDMGGMHGFGPVRPEANEPVFHADWEGRIFAIRAQLARFGGNIDRRRSNIEEIRPDRYLRISYYERWLDTALRYCAERGLISARERRAIETAKSERGIARAFSAGKQSPARVEPAPPRTGTGYARKIETPALFVVGARVRARNLHPPTHTRLPRYARGKVGVVVADHGGFVFPDTNAVGQGEQPRRLYTVRFSARELWGEGANARDTVSLDLWEPYLEREA